MFIRTWITRAVFALGVAITPSLAAAAPDAASAAPQFSIHEKIARMESLACKGKAVCSYVGVCSLNTTSSTGAVENWMLFFDYGARGLAFNDTRHNLGMSIGAPIVSDTPDLIWKLDKPESPVSVQQAPEEKQRAIRALFAQYVDWALQCTEQKLAPESQPQ